jgi:hypothetical protein
MKKRQIYLVLLLSIVGWLTLASCRKQKNASGQFLEYGTEKPVANATATLRSYEGEVLGNFFILTLLLLRQMTMAILSLIVMVLQSLPKPKGTVQVVMILLLSTVRMDVPNLLDYIFIHMLG